MQGAWVVGEGKAVLHLFHFLGCIGAVPRINGCAAGFGVADLERQGGRSKNREAPRLVARVDECKVGQAITRHVVMVKGFAQLLRGEKRGVDAATRRFFQAVCPSLYRGV